jgi:tRNA/rRNA methyltransferase
VERLPARSQLDYLCVVLVSTRNPLNVGAAARAMSNFGFSRLRVVNPYDVAFREARSAVGASDLLASAQQYASVAEAVADCTLVVGTTAARDRELHQPLHSLAQGASLIGKEAAVGPVALLFGSEKRGLSNDDLSHCHWLLRIPTHDKQPSMNLGQAVAVCLYELARHSPPEVQPSVGPLSPAGDLATAGEMERLTSTLTEALEAGGYLHPPSPAATEKVRRLVRRLNLRTQDAETLLAMLRQLLWKLRSNQ